MFDVQQFLQSFGTVKMLWSLY